MQRWKKVVGHPDYLVSNMGRVWSKKSNKLMKLVKNKRGYLQVNLSGKTLYIHRIVAEAFLANPEMKPQVHHIDHNPSNNDVLNLMWVTDAENKKYCHENGGYTGESARNVKLTEKDVLLMRHHYESENYSIKSLAYMFDVKYSTARKAIKGINWSHL